MQPLRSILYLIIVCMLGPSIGVRAQKVLQLSSNHLQLEWKSTPQGWQVQKVLVKKGNSWDSGLTPSGEYTLLFTEEKPSGESAQTFEKITGGKFPEDNYHYQREQWKESTTSVALNTAGKAYHFFPTSGKLVGKNHVQFRHETEVATVTTDWRVDQQFPTDVLVTQTITPKRKGYFSLASPSVATVAESSMGWASVPGYFQGNYLQDNFAKAYAYGHGVPRLPVIYRERCASTLAPLVSTRTGITLAIIPEPGLARDPWKRDKITQTDWHVGLSHMNRKGQLSPTLYYPVLGEHESSREVGKALSYNFRYSLMEGDWFKSLKHAIYDIYKFGEGLQLRQSKQSLMSRIEQMHHYLTDPQTSMWNVEEFEGTKIGAQSYLGGVVGSQKDAMKNSDYGAMWMLAHATADPKLTQQVLPYAHNFKLKQQQTEDGFFRGAAVGQYYLAKRKKFVEEWGEVVEPMGLTYYTMLDLGNILLFDPNNQELKDRLRLGAELLLKWQKPDGSWAVAYDRHSEQELFKDVDDLRPTFYGMIVAYRVLKDPRYLAAARKGADWFVKNAVETGAFLGVCGDARYAPDFATGQSAQALLDLYELTNEKRYKEAAITAAKIYTGSIYTHPIPTRTIKEVNGIQREDWEIAQSGLSFEHGGIFGSATRHGPIQLASHAGMFIRMYQLTGEPLFADMARAAAIGRDAFVDPKTSVASYYWNAMNRGAGPYPHHAWWQVGWITDYLLAEAELRSKGKISFPRGFVTPKVGPHQTYGFAPGTVNGDKARLVIREDWVKVDQPSVDYILAESVEKGRKYVILLNNRAQATNFNLTVGQKSSVQKQLPAWGMEIVQF
ncbi:glycerophosphoryl diester phosphodiesterase [Telluribacter sp. SYSU D00476]|uniref:glycerophosphoryl diester phosphodiesterase n=1 Tax=Telluribacter sp. SYSU D00476 TaxID=2811430 RepID=UPI001FF2EEFB|nr:glycerophosphoryl diester phosphodiesterase [Telluribacter sp. SYSU D00476]